ncbi:NAD(P)-dependent oxidoreductase [Mucilaginibacter galii]|uniref:NAD(P)-dependent oxidoreductase n=2 Tax=Mucilaginibacter galii TaxID=2005073 RepID=A0A917J7P0_9SPHI|nr:NAD(P)-dependent oxidoreductase [Mucilaginibacter galii]
MALGKALAQDGENVKGSTTSNARFDAITAAGIIPYLLTLSAEELITNDDFFACNTLIVSIPPRMRSGETDYTAKIQQLIKAIIKQGVQQVIYISSTGVYPDGNSDLNENDHPAPQSQSNTTLFEAEELFRKQTNFKTAIIRFGGLVGPGRNPGRFFAGKTNVPNGQAPVNLIHLQDCVALTKSILNQEAFGYTFNACSPHHPQKAQFYTQATLHAGLEAPSFNDELLEWKTVSSINVPAVLHYEYAINNWDDCFAGNCF